jgi:hypothetical protein
MYTRWARHAHTPGNAPIWPSLRYTLDTHWIRPGYTGCASDTPRDTLGRAGGTMGAYWIHTGFTTDTRWIHCVCITGAPEARAYGTYWIRNGYTLDTHGIHEGADDDMGIAGYNMDTCWIQAGYTRQALRTRLETWRALRARLETRCAGQALYTHWIHRGYVVDTSGANCLRRGTLGKAPATPWAHPGYTMGTTWIHDGYTLYK